MSTDDGEEIDWKNSLLLVIQGIQCQVIQNLFRRILFP